MLNDTPNTITYTGNGVTTVFPFTFRVDEADTVVVTLLDIATSIATPLAPSEYSLSLSGESGGTVTYPLIGSPLAATQKITIDRILPLEQNLDIGSHSAWNEESLEQQFDRIVMMLQQLQTNIDRNIYGPDSGAIADAAVAAAALFVAKAGSTSTGKQIFRASAASEASIRLQSGVAPSAPAVGDVWSTGAIMQARMGSNLTFMFLEEAHVFGIGSKQSFTHSATTAGIQQVPAAGDPSGLSNGDQWYNSTIGRVKVRLEGVTQEIGIIGVNAEALGKIALDNPQSGNYTLALLDAGGLVRGTSASAANITIPNNATIAFPVRTFITLAQYGTGQLTFVPASGVTMRSASGKNKTVSQYSAVTLIKIATDEWMLFGDITT
jgi:hypothetical protein